MAKNKKLYTIVFEDRSSKRLSLLDTAKYLRNEYEKRLGIAAPQQACFKGCINTYINKKHLRPPLVQLGVIDIIMNSNDSDDTTLTITNQEESNSPQFNPDLFYSAKQIENEVREVIEKATKIICTERGAGHLTGPTPQIYTSPFDVPLSDQENKPCCYIRICLAKQENKKKYIGEVHSENQNYHKRTKNGYTSQGFGRAWCTYGEWGFINLVIPCNHSRDALILEQLFIKEFQTDDPEYGWNSTSR